VKLLQTLLALLLLASIAMASVQKPAHHKITAQQAQAVALKKYHGKVVGKVELENEDGKWQYAVNIRSGKTLREVMVGADSGKIESVEVTTPKEEAREKAAKTKKKGGK
jgi:uncharacterized membrane protein YkoI